MRDRILHLADLHLGERHEYLGERADSRRREADGLLERIVERVLAEDSRIGCVLIAGDLFEHYVPESALVERTISALGRLVERGIHLLTVPGNHDEYSYPHCVYRTHGNRWPGRLVTTPRPERVASWELGERVVDVYSMAFVAGASRPPFDEFAVESNDHQKIAVLHGTLDLPSGDRSLPLSTRRLKKLGLDYVALGHLHAPMERALGAKGRVAYSGRIEGAGFHDPGGAPLLEVELTPNGPLLHRSKLESREVRTEEIVASACASPDELDSRIERLARTHGEAILRLDIRGLPGFPLDAAALRARWESRFHFLHVVIRDEGASNPLDLGVLASEPTVRGRFTRIALERIELCKDEQERRVAEAALREGLAAFASTASGRTR